jgi:hypothetical protein
VGIVIRAREDALKEVKQRSETLSSGSSEASSSSSSSTSSKPSSQESKQSDKGQDTIQLKCARVALRPTKMTLELFDHYGLRAAPDTLIRLQLLDLAAYGSMTTPVGTNVSMTIEGEMTLGSLVVLDTSREGEYVDGRMVLPMYREILSWGSTPRGTQIVSRERGQQQSFSSASASLPPCLMAKATRGGDGGMMVNLNIHGLRFMFATVLARLSTFFTVPSADPLPAQPVLTPLTSEYQSSIEQPKAPVIGYQPPSMVDFRGISASSSDSTKFPKPLHIKLQMQDSFVVLPTGL